MILTAFQMHNSQEKKVIFNVLGNCSSFKSNINAWIWIIQTGTVYEVISGRMHTYIIDFTLHSQFLTIARYFVELWSIN